MKKSELKNNVESYLNEEMLDEKAKSTIIHYRHIIEMFINYIDHEDITKLDLLEFKKMLIENYKPKTVNNYILIVNKFIKYIELSSNEEEFDFAMLRNYHSKQLLKNVKIQNKSSLVEVLEPIEFKRLLRMAKKNNEMDMYYIMKIIAYTGVRAEELKKFTYENIQSNFIEVKNKGKIRNIIIPNDLRRELLAYCKQNNIKQGYIFRGRKEGTMIHSTTIYKRMKKIAGQCRGIKKEKIHAHSFRHLFAIKFLEESGDITELADILGHTSIETTRIYTRTTDNMKKKKLEKMKY